MTLQYLDNSIPDISWETLILSSPENAFTLKFGLVLIFCFRVTSAKSSHDITSVCSSCCTVHTFWKKLLGSGIPQEKG